MARLFFMKEALIIYKEEVEQEAENILAYWMAFTIDKAHGGFVGRIDNDNNVHPQAPKGAVLNSRILWTFSAAHNLNANDDYLATASRAFDYLRRYFFDEACGGVYWTVDYKGQPLDTKKQIYAQAFAIYGLSEYYTASENEAAKQAAITLYQTVVEHSYDKTHGGYAEALSKEWQPIADLRLSEKDANEKKSMNTHLHLLEGFAALYRIWPDEGLKEKLRELIYLFLQHIISTPAHNLTLFFDDEWTPRSTTVSYGHDIEAAWLLQEAAGLMDDEELLLEVKKASVQLAKAAAKGLDGDGGLWYEYEPERQHLIKQKHWWPQAEAMVGFFNAWQITGDEVFLSHSLNSWQFVKEKLLNKSGEWFWGRREDGDSMVEDKVGLWKCPYHNGRACMEISRRINAIGKVKAV